MNATQQSTNLHSLEAVPRRSTPAWLLSAVVHLVALITFALLFRGVAQALPDESDRGVSIVLAQASDNENVEYLNESTAASEATNQTDPSSNPPPLPTSTTEPPPLSIDIKLPGRPDTPIAEGLTNDLVVVPSVNPAQRRPILPSDDQAEILAAQLAMQKLGGGPKGDAAQVGIFGGGGVPGHSFVFVIDRSKSMGGQGLGVLSAASTEIQTALERLQSNHEFQIIAYNHKTAMVDERRLLKGNDEDKAKVAAFFAGLAAFGSTSHESALYAALRLKPDVIFFLTDGGDPYLNSSQIEQLSDRAGRRTAIHCIRFGFGPQPDDNNFMEALASRNRGSYRYVDMSKRKG